jgi:nucleotide-binding universal stress UspA family protein
MAWFPKKTVVAPVDFSELSWEAVDTALELAAAPAGVHVVHVLPVLEPAEPGVIWHTIDDETRSRHAAQAVRERLAAPKYHDVQVQIAFGDPGTEIADYARRVGADLIVLPSHGRTGIARFLIGSVAERVVRLAHCPVLVLRK